MAKIRVCLTPLCDYGWSVEQQPTQGGAVTLKHTLAHV